MKPFRAAFLIIEDNNCPLYELKDIFVLTEKSISFPEGKESCLILVREMTQLLFQLLGEMDQRPDLKKKYTCSGCTGLIKFRQINDDSIGKYSAAEPLLTDVEKRMFDRISEYPLLKAIPTNHLKKFIGCFKGRVFRKDELVVRQGQPNLRLYLILSGELSIEDGGVPVATLGEGDICGEMSYYGDNIANSTIRTMKDARLLSIKGDDFGKLIRDSETVQLYMVRLLADRLSHSRSAKKDDFDTCMQGRIRDMAPAELLQVFHMHQKTGVLSLELSKGPGRIVFFEGAIIKATFQDKKEQDAVFAILSEREGTYIFTIGISEEEAKLPPIGDFMMMLMEGVKRVDED